MIRSTISKLFKTSLHLGPWVVLLTLFHFSFQQFYPFSESLKGPQFFDFITEIDFYIFFLILFFILAFSVKAIKPNFKILTPALITVVLFLLISALIQFEFQTTYEPILVTPHKYFRSLILFPLTYFLLLITSFNKKDLQVFSYSFFCMISTLCILSLFQYFTNFFPGETTDFVGRLNWPFVDFLSLKSASANWLAFVTTPALVLSFISFVTKFPSIYKKKALPKNLFSIALTFATFILTSTVVYLTQSYGAYISAFAAITIFLFRHQPIKKFLISIVAITLIAGSIAIIQQNSPKAQILKGDRDYKYANSVSSRKSIYQMGLHIIKQHPIKGIGLNQFQSYFAQNQESVLGEKLNESHTPPHAHNFFLSFWTNLGIFGVLAMFILIVSIIWNSKLSPANPAVFALIAIMIHGLIDSYYWRIETAYIFWIIIAASVLMNSLKRQSLRA